MSPFESAASSVAIALILSALACSDGVEPSLFDEGFEEACDDAPCDWQQIESSTGSARATEYEHPGEHGVRLEGDVEILTEPRDATLVLQFDVSLPARIIARCDSDSTLVVRAVLVPLDGGPDFEPFEGSAFPASDLPSEGFFGLAPGTAGSSPAPSGQYRIDAISIEKSGAGACEVWHLEVREPSFGEDDLDVDC